MPEQELFPRPDPDRFKHLDQFLSDLPDSKKLKIYDLTLKTGIDPEDPLWLVCGSLNKILVLFEDTPKTLSQFTQELQSWSNQNIEILQVLSQKAKTIEELSLTTKELTSSLTILASLSQGLISQLQNSAQNSATFQADLKKSRSNIIALLKKIVDTQEQQNRNLASHLNKPVKTRNWSGNIALILSAITLVMVGINFFQQSSLKEALSISTQQTKWILHRTLIRDCQDGLKPSDSPECRGL